MKESASHSPLPLGWGRSSYVPRNHFNGCQAGSHLSNTAQSVRGGKPLKWFGS